MVRVTLMLKVGCECCPLLMDPEPLAEYSYDGNDVERALFESGLALAQDEEALARLPRVGELPDYSKIKRMVVVG